MFSCPLRRGHTFLWTSAWNDRHGPPAKATFPPPSVARRDGYLTLWSSGRIARTLRAEEQRKVELWSEVILQRAELVRYTDALFASLREEERNKADLMGEAYRIIQEADPGAPIDLTFITRFIQGNRTIPVLVYRDGTLQADINVPEPLRTPQRLDSLRFELASRGTVIEFEQGLVVYYDQSNRFRELQSVMDDLIHSFLSETVLNSASIPVLLADSTLQNILQADRIPQAELADTSALIRRLVEVNPPIALDLPESGRRWILYDESLVLKQLRYFPVVQLLIIGGFLLLAYSTFSAFRRSEQNRVWVGMAKETAHQLGTPLSALLAWVEVLRIEGVEEEMLVELEKDLGRLRTVTDRFSKIGSEPELTVGPRGVHQGDHGLFGAAHAQSGGLHRGGPGCGGVGGFQSRVVWLGVGEPHQECGGRDGGRGCTVVEVDRGRGPGSTGCGRHGPGHVAPGPAPGV